MKSTFSGFPKEGIAFLRALKKNNDREWFTPRKPNSRPRCGNR